MPPPAAHPPTVPRFSYQPALDGWRGIGILMVMAYHAGGRSIVPGAFLWIDGFFTVSAFLIATLLLEEWHGSGRISLTAFWSRRIRRLGPALVLTLAAMPVFGAFAASRAQRAELPHDVLATLFYVANWRSIAMGSDYFAAFADDSPLKHTWSLAIEEQFYVLFPLLLVGLLALARRVRRGGPAVLGVVAVGGALASAAWMAWLHAGGATTSRLYYGTDTRAQSLLVGVALAVWHRRAAHRVAEGTATPRPALATVAPGVVAFVALVAAQFVVHETSPALYQGGFLAAAAGQALVFRALLTPGWFQRALAWRPLVWVGGLAYGLYLFHFPLFLALSPARVGLDGVALFAVRFAAAFALAVPVMRLVEQPIRSRRWPAPGSALARVAWPAAVAAIAVAALVVTPPPPEPTRTDLQALVVPAPDPGPPAAGPAGTGPADDTGTGPTGTGPTGTGPTGTGPTGTGPTGTGPTGTGGSIGTAPAPTSPRRAPRVAVVGDSTGTRLSPGIDAWASVTHQLVFVGDGARVGCPLGRGGEMHTAADVTGPVNSSCNWATAPAAGFDGVTRQPWPAMLAAWDPQLVVVSFGPWDVTDRRLPGDPTWRSPGDPVYDRWLLGEMAAAIDTLTARGAHVVWLTQPPWEGLTRHPPERAYPPAGDPARMARFNELVRQAAAAAGRRVTVVEFGAWITGTGEDARLRPDGAHLEPETAVEVMNRFLGPELVRIWRTLPAPT